MKGMTIRKVVAAALLVAGLVGGVQTRSDAASGNTLTVTMYASKGMKAKLHIYGPNGYYRSAGYGPFPKGSGLVRSFSGAPCCDYRIRVVWSSGRETNLYGKVFSASSGQYRCRTIVSDGYWNGSC